MISERIEKIRQDLEFFEEDIDKYEYIVDLGRRLNILEDELKDDSLLIHGCTSKVWLLPSLVDGKIIIKADSNSVIVKGLVSILVYIFSGIEPLDIINFNVKDLEVLNLTEIISPTRQNGLFHMINRILEYAALWRL
ncbi:MAG: SufE family protein [Spirochaetales bacterium]|nr:SufE family protein [Spirochaetales bacterium]